MRAIRVYVDAPLQPGTEQALPPEPAHHVARVLRLKPGQSLTLFNGRGGQYAATIRAVDRNRVTVRIEAHEAVEHESPLAITLVQAIAGGRAMDYALQKAVELGVAAIVPITAERGKVRLDDKRARARLDHWQGGIAAACEQCGRNRLPELAPVTDLFAWLRQAPAGPRLLLDPESDRRLHELADPGGRLALLAGPEGGFSSDERAASTDAGCTPVGLGPRVLRTETAAPAAITACQVLWGDLA